MTQKKLGMRLMLCIALSVGATYLLKYTHGWGQVGILIGPMIFVLGARFMVKALVIQEETEYNNKKNF